MKGDKDIQKSLDNWWKYFFFILDKEGGSTNVVLNYIDDIPKLGLDDERVQGLRYIWHYEPGKHQLTSTRVTQRPHLNTKLIRFPLSIMIPINLALVLTSRYVYSNLF